MSVDCLVAVEQQWKAMASWVLALDEDLVVLNLWLED